MTMPIPPTVKPKPPSQRPRPEGPHIRARVCEALAIAIWEIDPQRVRELAGLPELSDELIAHRVDMLLKAGVPWLFVDGARKLRKRHRK
jgi:hypothetical protein